MAAAAAQIVCLKYDPNCRDVLLNMWWQESDFFSMFERVSPDFPFYELVDLLQRSRFDGPNTFQDVVDYLEGFPCVELTSIDEVDMFLSAELPAALYGVRQFLGLPDMHPSWDSFTGTVRVEIAFHSDETDVDISFFTPDVLQTRLSESRDVSIATVLGEGENCMRIRLEVLENDDDDDEDDEDEDDDEDDEGTE